MAVSGVTNQFLASHSRAVSDYLIIGLVGVQLVQPIQV